MFRCIFLFPAIFYMVRANDCPEGWTNVDNFCMAYMDKPLTWALASTICQTEGGYLASLQSELKNKLAIDYLRQLNVKQSVWLSGTDAHTEGHWMWTPSDQLMTFQFWGRSHSDNDNNNDCLVMDMSQHHWTDRDCYNAKYPYLCEKYLASLQSELKNKLAIDYLRQLNVNTSVWLSGTDAHTEGHWMWTPSDQLMTFQFLSPNHDDSDNDSDCLVMDMHKNHWADRNCYIEEYPYLCEKHEKDTSTVIG